MWGWGHWEPASIRHETMKVCAHIVLWWWRGEMTQMFLAGLHVPVQGEGTREMWGINQCFQMARKQGGWNSCFQLP